MIAIQVQGDKYQSYNNLDLDVNTGASTRLSDLDEALCVHISKVTALATMRKGAVFEDTDILNLMSGEGQVPNSNAKLLAPALNDNSLFFRIVWSFSSFFNINEVRRNARVYLSLIDRYTEKKESLSPTRSSKYE